MQIVHGILTVPKIYGKTTTIIILQIYKLSSSFIKKFFLSESNWIDMIFIYIYLYLV